MKIERAVSLGYQKSDKGNWRIKINTVDYRTKKRYWTWRSLIENTCATCKEIFVATYKIQKFCSVKCQSNMFGKGPGWRKGKKFPNEKGGYGNKRITDDGYVMVYAPGHPLVDKSGRVLEHRLIMYEKLGNKFDKNCIVHHKNGIKNDNRISNLVCITQSKHVTEHNLERIKNGTHNFLKKYRFKKGRLI